MVMFRLPEKAKKPTMYFIGVTTTKSSIMRIFPLWANELKIDAELVGIDIDIHAEPGIYRQVVAFIKDDQLSYGALVTTHKIDLLDATRDMFDYLDPYALLQGEISSISKADNLLRGHAKDPISSGLAMESFIPEYFWRDHKGDAFIMGAGGSSRAICSYLADKNKGKNRPSRIIISNRSKPRLEKARQLMTKLNSGISDAYYLTPTPELNDKVVQLLKPYSLVVNATGLGKDRPGSPITDQCRFPENSLVWEINYRGDLKFMYQALTQQEGRKLHVEDGWIYFIHGWTQVIAEVFHINISGKIIASLKHIAEIDK